MVYDLICDLDIFVTSDETYNRIQVQDICNRLVFQYKSIGADEFMAKSLGKTNREYILGELNKGSIDYKLVFDTLMANPAKRNAGDNFKHIVNDNWSVNLIFTMNLRALGNYLKLRKAGSAYFQIQWLANEIWDQIPENIKPVLKKNYKNNKTQGNNNDR
jgi:thymidylate synthase (FAD)